MKNTTRTAVINIFKICILQTYVSCFSTYIFKSITMLVFWETIYTLKKSLEPGQRWSAVMIKDVLNNTPG